MRRPVPSSTSTHSRLRSRRRALQIAARVFVFLLLVAGVTFVARAQIFQIKTVEIAGAQDLDSAAITHDIEAELAGAYLGLVPRSNRFVYPKGKIERELEGKYSRLASTTLKASLSGTLKVRVSEEPLRFVQCPSLGSSSDCVFINKSGKHLAPAREGEGTVRLVGSSTPITSLDLVDALAGSGIEIKEVRDKGAGDLELVTSEGWPLWVGSTSPETLRDRARAALQTKALQSPEARAKLLYLDLRFGNKIFYKFGVE